MPILGMAGGPPVVKKYFDRNSPTAAISPEQAEANAAVGFDPETDTPQDPRTYGHMLKPVGHYQGWGGLQSIGEGLYNAGVWQKINQAQQEQRASARAGGQMIQDFVASGGMAAGPEAIAPLFMHPGTRDFAKHQLDRYYQQNDPLRLAQIDYYKSRAGLNDSRAGRVTQMAARFRQNSDGMWEKVPNDLPVTQPTQQDAAPRTMADGPPKLDDDGKVVVDGSMEENAGEGDIPSPPQYGPRRTALPPLPADASPRQMKDYGRGALDIRKLDQQNEADDAAQRYRDKGKPPTKFEAELDPDFQEFMAQRYPRLKLKTGWAYGADGIPVDLTEYGKEKHNLQKVGPMLQDIRDSAAILKDTNFVGRALANGVTNPATKQAMDQVDHAISQLTALVEGKRHANAQDVRMLKFFSPQWHDSAETIGFKLDQLNRIFTGYFNGNAQRGDIFKSALQKAIEQARQKGLIEDKPTGATATPAAGMATPQIRQPRNPLYDKLGLE